jgi:hypothetical protein
LLKGKVGREDRRGGACFSTAEAMLIGAQAHAGPLREIAPCKALKGEIGSTFETVKLQCLAPIKGGGQNARNRLRFVNCSS